MAGGHDGGEPENTSAGEVRGQGQRAGKGMEHECSTDQLCTQLSNFAPGLPPKP